MPIAPRGVRRVAMLLPLALAVIAPPPAAAAAPPPTAACQVGSTVVTNVMAARNWNPLTRTRWRFPGTEVIQIRPGVPPPGPRRPYEYAVLTAGPRFGPVQIDAEVRIDTPVSVSGRDVVVLFGYQTSTRFYYVHLSNDNRSYPHNGIFLVDNADRLRIDDQWNGSSGARPAITDAAYHHVRIQHCAASGQIAVFLDGSATPLMTATNPTLRSGRVGFGSFDNTGRLRNLTVTGTPAT